jgi:hypothetical protein
MQYFANEEYEIFTKFLFRKPQEPHGEPGMDMKVNLS